MNMAYCRFRNTLTALQDCIDKLQEHHYDLEELKKDLSPDEFSALKKLLALMEEATIDAEEAK